jgi:hypothetical protein
LYLVGIGVVSDGLRFGCAARGAGQPGISAELRARSQRPMAACGGGCSSNVRPACRSSMQRAAKPDFSEAFCRTRGPWRLAFGRRSVSMACDGEWRWSVTWRSAGERSEGRARVAGTHCPNGAGAAINPGWSRSSLNAVGGWKHGLLITDFAGVVNSEIALLCEWEGAATHGDLLVGSGGTYEEIARLLEGGFVGRALPLPQRAALEPLDPSSGDRLVGTGASPRADRAITRRRDCRPRAWGEARGPRNTRSRSMRSHRRAVA